MNYHIFTTDATKFKEYYWGAKEETARMMPRPRGVPVWTTAFVDSSHDSEISFWAHFICELSASEVVEQKATDSRY